MPFVIPESWCWTSIGELFEHNTGKALNASNRDGKMMDYITTSNLYWDRFDLSVVKQMLFTEEELWRCTAKKGDLLICEGGDIGRAAIWNYDYDIRIQNHIHRLRGYGGINHRFYYFVFLLYKLSNRIGGKGVAIQGLSSGDLHKLEVPLPPECEQIRLVKTIDKWFKFVDLLEQEQENLHSLAQSTKSKILGLAISGKLVPQDPNDEPAIELLKRINPAFEPCDNSHYENLPQGWAFCKIKDIFNITMGQSPTGESINGVKGIEFHQGKIHFTESYLSQSGVYTDQPTKIAEVDSLLLCVRAPVGVLNITQRKICIGRGLCALKPKYEIDNLYWLFILTAYKDYFESNATGSTFKAISGDTIKNAVIKLPPLQEQERILYSIISLYESLDAITAEL